MSLLSMLPLVSAQYSGGGLGNFFGEGMRTVIDAVVGFASPVFEVLLGQYSTSQFFFSKVLFLILFFIIINLITSNLPFINDENKKIGVIIALIISILSVRFISENDFFTGILLPYGTLGVAIGVIIPFLVFFYFVERFMGGGSAGRRIAWIFYAIIFIALWNSRAPEISAIMNQIYGWTLAAIILAVIFDKSIHKYLALSDIRKLGRTTHDRNILKLIEDLERAQKFANTPEGKREIDRITKQLEKLGLKASS